MKRLFLVLFILSISSLFAQKVEFMNPVTVANSASKTFYLPINNKEFARLDSVQIVFSATGEIDLDQLIVTKGNVIDVPGSYGTIFNATATPDTTTLTVDNAASVTTVVSFKASTIALTGLAPYDVIRVVFKAGSAGNDATDPNRLYVRLIPYYTYLK